MVQKIAIIGSTGTLGRLALDVIEKNPGRFKIVGLATFQNAELLAEQAESALGEHTHVPFLTALHQGDSWEKFVEECGADRIFFASSGVTALPALFKAIALKKNIALANKELLVVAGEEIMTRARGNGVQIIPVDSEHSGIFQCLQGEKMEDVEKVTLTCSGGPFRGKTRAELEHVTAEEALNHPSWNMGKEISIDSAT
ncbi:MAG TPA: 1-deoxy-D-xylulose-5-phosphate reductoisomerase, partial [Candidatus Gracilibacteria bacterium]|nr:1-deoxy-D-xylulose-5-phosphate reductoisomerase [Candidatus Gracilibacteria bacterium]